MKRKITLIAMAVALLLLAAVGVSWWMTADSLSGAEGWGHGKLRESERAYYVSRVNRIIANWQQRAMDARRSEDGRVAEPYHTFLVIDTTEQAVWIEQAGRVDRMNYTELPPSMQWEIYRSALEGNTRLPEKARFEIRGIYSKRILPEMLYLVGRGRRLGNMHIHFHFDAGSIGSGYGSSQFQPQPYQGRSRDKDNCYGSIVVTDNEYETYRLTLAADPNAAAPEAGSETGTAVARNLRNWLAIEKQLYLEIDRQVTIADFDLKRLGIEPGPDYTAGHAEVRATQQSGLRRILGGGLSAEAYLKIDYLGDGVWYAKTWPHPARPMGPGRQLDLEFLISAGKDMPASEQDRWLDRGREKQQPVPRPPSPWRVTLPNGSTVEFIGICVNPSAGKIWWGPDGSPLDYAPYVNVKPYGPVRDDRKMYEIAWRIDWPAHQGGSGTRSSLQGCIGTHGRQIRDRYGNRLIGGLHAEGYAFDKSREKTSLTLGLKLNDQDYETVVFKNISLVPGKDPGFQIEVQR